MSGHEIIDGEHLGVRYRYCYWCGRLAKDCRRGTPCIRPASEA